MYDNGIYIISGASNGNGRSIAEKLIRRNKRVINVDINKSEDSLEFFMEFIGSVDDPKLAKKVLETASKNSEEVYLVNNAGITLPSKGEYPLEFWKKTLDVNLTGPYIFLEKFSVEVESNQIKKGSIVNIGSLSSHRAFPDNPAYVASKHGVIGLTKYYAWRLGKFGFRVNSVSPGYIRTAMTTKSQSDVERSRLIEKSTFLGRWGETDDVSDAVLFLLSEESTFVSGIDLVVDGGWLAQGLVE